MKKYIIIFLLMFLMAIVNAQNAGEIKLDVWNALYKSFLVSYELPVSKKSTLEAEMGYGFKSVDLDTSALIIGGWGLYPMYFDYEEFTASLSWKIYPKPKTSHDRFYLGVFTRFDKETWRDPKYDYLFIQKYGYKLPLKTSMDIGVTFGYKWLLWERLSIQPEIPVRLFFLYLTDIEKSIPGINSKLLIKIGYRFYKRTVDESSQS